MNRKSKEKENDPERQQAYVEPVPPKFCANWTQVVRFDRIVMNISDCSYEVVQKVGKQLKWKVKNEPNNAEWDVWWTDWAVPPEVLMKMEHHQKINHFPGMYTLSRKNLLAKNLMKMRKKNAEEYNYFPLTWNLPVDFNQFKAYFESKPKGKARTYIVKPQSLSQGKGIFLTRKIEDINPQQHCVVQRYLSKPYLIQGLKFDLRIYVLVAGVDPLRLYIFREGLARFATENYVMPNKDNMEDVCMHLTNYAINKESQKFVFNQDQNDMSIGHKRSLEAVFKIMQEKGVDIVKLKLKIHEIIVKTLISGLSHLKFQYRSCQPQNYRSDMCFQILGFDIIINDEMEPILLEINYTPSFSTDTPLDWNIKKHLIKDALTIMQVTKQLKEATVKERKQYRDLRMMTGKKNKLSVQEKQERRKQAQIQRDNYINQNLGGFTKIFPLPAEDPRMEVYENLIKLEAEASGIVTTEKKLDKSKNSQNINPPIRRNTEKITKLLPTIPVPKQGTSSSKHSANRLIISKRMTELSKISKIDDQVASSKNISSSNQTATFFEEKTGDNQNSMGNHMGIVHQLSQKLIRKVKLKQIPFTKKKGNSLVRETLVPKTIQFEGNKYDGLCDYYKAGMNNGNQE